MKLRFLHIYLFIFSAVSLIAQKPKFYADIDARKVIEGSYVQVTFVLENGQGSGFKLPKMDDFVVVSGPSTSNSTKIFNGHKTTEVGYTYGLQPKGLGVKVIPAASMTVNGKTMNTTPVSIEVVKGASSSVDKDKQIFVRTFLTDTSVYVGQQILLEYKLYTMVDVRNINFGIDNEFEGFFAEELRISQRGYIREVIDGVEYHVRPIKQVALFPQQTGTYMIPPNSVSLGIVKQGASRGFFYNSQLIPKTMIAEGKTIVVNELPPTTGTFSGAVGRYRMSAKANKNSLTTDEAITVIMEVVGNGDSKTVSPPKWPLPDGLEMYEPNVIQDEVVETTKGKNHKKIFEYLIVAKTPGRYKLIPSFHYFDTDSLSYRTLIRNLGTINVVKGSDKAPVDIQESTQDVAEIFQSTKLKSKGSSTFNPVFQWVALLLPFFIGIGIYLYGARLDKLGKRDPALLKREKAYGIAVSRLETSKKYMDKDEGSKFYEEMISAIKSYITDKYSIPALHIKKSELLKQLQQKEITESDISILEEILTQSEMGMYAPGAATQLSETYSAALELIARLEN